MDNLTKAQRLKNMRNIRSKNTWPEKVVAKELRRRKIYFSEHTASVLGKPDFLFRRKKVAVFIDSDFWHGNPGHFTMPKSNVGYWKAKIHGNIRRDKIVTATLKRAGWTVLRLWEHSIHQNLNREISRIIRALGVNS